MRYLNHKLMHAGFGIVELMVAMTLSLILLAGVVSVFVGSRSTYETIDRWSRIQENGRFALDQIMRDIRSAGYLGCARGVKYKSTTLNNATTLPWDFSTAITGFEATGTNWSPAMDSTVVQPALNNDVLVLRAPVRDAISLRLQTTMAASNSAITVANVTPAPLSTGDIVLLTNCEAQATFQVTGYTSNAGGDTIGHDIVGGSATSPGNGVNDLSFAFPANSEAVQVHTIVYYVRQSNGGTGTTCDATNPCSLWRRIGTNTPEELVEGVDSMQVLYGVDTDGNGEVDTYSTADTVATTGQWDSVLSVRIALLERSLDEYGSDVDAKTYTLLDTTAGPYNDRRIRQVFTSTIALRNRAP